MSRIDSLAGWLLAGLIGVCLAMAAISWALELMP